MDIVHNAVTAQATEIAVVYDQREPELLVITVEDNGKGMTTQQSKLALGTFYTTGTTQTGGKGLPNFRLLAESTGGKLELFSTLGKGTKVMVHIFTAHPNMLPIGNTAETLKLLMLGYPKADFSFTFYKNNSKVFSVNTKEIKTILEEVPINHPDVASWLEDYLWEGTESLML